LIKDFFAPQFFAPGIPQSMIFPLREDDFSGVTFIQKSG